MEWTGADWQQYAPNSNTHSIEVTLTGESGIGNELQCPLCKDVINQAHVSVNCLHRFCKNCIHQFIQLSSDPFVICPVCFVPFHRDVDLKKDPRFDRLIALWHVSPLVRPGCDSIAQPLRLEREQHSRTLDGKRLMILDEKSDQHVSDDREPDTKNVVSFRGAPQRSTPITKHITTGRTRKRQRQNITPESVKQPKAAVNYGTSLKVILRPKNKNTPSTELFFNLQKDTSINTLKELVRGHMSLSTGIQEYQKGRVDFFIHLESEDVMDSVKDYSNRIGQLQKSIPRVEGTDELVLFFDAFKGEDC